MWVVGRGERIRTSDLTVPNEEGFENLTNWFQSSCSHEQNQGFLNLLTFVTILYHSHPIYSCHKSATAIFDCWSVSGVQKSVRPRRKSLKHAWVHRRPPLTAYRWRADNFGSRMKECSSSQKDHSSQPCVFTYPLSQLELENWWV